jgi:hypothetical protein
MKFCDKMEALLAKGLQPRCEPENPNLNTLTCKYCKRQWYFEPGYGWRQSCPVQSERNVTLIANALPAILTALRAAEAASKMAYRLPRPWMAAQSITEAQWVEAMEAIEALRSALVALEGL